MSDVYLSCNVILEKLDVMVMTMDESNIISLARARRWTLSTSRCVSN